MLNVVLSGRMVRASSPYQIEGAQQMCYSAFCTFSGLFYPIPISCITIESLQPASIAAGEKFRRMLRALTVVVATCIHHQEIARSKCHNQMEIAVAEGPDDRGKGKNEAYV
jgi:hypothetical protein